MRDDPNKLVIKCLTEFVKGDRVFRQIHGKIFCFGHDVATPLAMRDGCVGWKSERGDEVTLTFGATNKCWQAKPALHSGALQRIESECEWVTRH